MNSSLSTPERPASVLTIAPVFTKNGFSCSLVTLAPGAGAPLPASRSPDDQVLLVIDGDIAIHAAEVTTIVNRGDAFLLAPGESPVVSARVGAPARVLRMEIPPRPAGTPPRV